MSNFYLFTIFGGKYLKQDIIGESFTKDNSGDFVAVLY
jgi:hypothetical protein